MRFLDFRGEKNAVTFGGSRALQSGSALRCATVVVRNSRVDGGGGSRRRRSCRCLEAPAITESKVEFVEEGEVEWKYDASLPDGRGGVDGGSSPDCMNRRPDVGVELSFGVFPEGGVLPEVDEEQAGRGDALKEC